MAPAMPEHAEEERAQVRNRGPGERKASAPGHRWPPGPGRWPGGHCSRRPRSCPRRPARGPSAAAGCRPQDAPAAATRPTAPDSRPSQMSEPFWFSTYRMRPRVPSRSREAARDLFREVGVGQRADGLGRQVLVDVLQDLPVRIAPCIQEQLRGCRAAEGSSPPGPSAAGRRSCARSRRARPRCRVGPPGRPSSVRCRCAAAPASRWRCPRWCLPSISLIHPLISRARLPA